MTGRRDRPADAAVLTLLLLAAVISGLSLAWTPPAHRVLVGVLLGVQSLLALGRRRAPVTMLWCCAGAAVLDAAVAATMPVWPWAVLVFAVVRRVPGRRAGAVVVASTVAALVTAALAVELVPLPGDRDRGDLSDVAGTAAGLGVVVVPVLAVAAGVALAARRRARRLAAARAARERERVAGVLVAERERIAADLSSLVVARVRALLRATRALPVDGEASSGALRQVGEEARAALDGMRRALGLLRAAPDPDAEPDTGSDAHGTTVAADATGRGLPRRRRDRWGPSTSGVVIAALVAATVVASAAAVARFAPPGPRAGLLGLLDLDPARPASAVILVPVLALGWWRRAPLSALVVSSLGSVAGQLLGVTHLVVEGSWFVLAYAAGAGAPVLLSGLVLVASSTAVAVGSLGGTALAQLGSPSPASIVTSYAIGAAVWGLGVAQRRAALAEDRGRRARALDREMRARRAQRLGLARELHDVLAHELSAVVVTTHAAHVAGGGAAGAAAIRDAAARIADVLPSLTATAPEPSGPVGVGAGALGAAELEALAAPARAAGIPVEVRVEGQPAPADDPSAQLPILFARRVVTESLSNVLRHAGASPVCLRVEHRRDAVVVEVTDAGPVVGHRPPETAGGLGLVGMRERVLLLGGRLEAGPAVADASVAGPPGAGPAETAGWRVRAVLPRASPSQGGGTPGPDLRPEADAQAPGAFLASSP